MKLTPIYKFILSEQEDIEPIGGEITSPNEFAYFDFKSWAYQFGTKELFREKKFLASNGIEYTLEEATEMGAGQLFDVLTQIWKLWASETGDNQFGRIKDENVQEFGKALYNMMKNDGKGFFFKGEEMGAKVGDDADYLKQTYGVEMNEEKVRKLIKEVIIQESLLQEAAPALGAIGAAVGRAFASIGTGIGRAAAGTGKALARGASRVATGARQASTKYGKRAKAIAKDYAKDKAIDAAVDKLIPPGDEDHDDGVHDDEFNI